MSSNDCRMVNKLYGELSLKLIKNLTRQPAGNICNTLLCSVIRLFYILQDVKFRTN